MSCLGLFGVVVFWSISKGWDEITVWFPRIKWDVSSITRENEAVEMRIFMRECFDLGVGVSILF